MFESTSLVSCRVGHIAASMVASALLVGSGLVHGRLTDRWTSSDAIIRAIARLDQVPRSIGEWESRDVTMDRRQIERAEIRGYLARKYRNIRDGREITILLVCGRPGPIAVHTPDVCYAGAGYEADAPAVPGTVATANRGVELLEARFRKIDALVPEVLDILWAWNARGLWEIPANPRITFAPYQALFKLYVIAARGGTAAAARGGPSVDQDFAELLLIELDRALFGNEGHSAKATSPVGGPPSL